MAHSEAVDSRESAGAPENEIAVTPAMVEAGVDALGGFDPAYEPIHEAAIRIYQSMERSKKPRTSCDQQSV
jgi:hypothetical protein